MHVYQRQKPSFWPVHSITISSSGSCGFLFGHLGISEENLEGALQKNPRKKKKKHTQTHLGLALFGTCSRLLTGLPQRVGAEVKARKAWCLLGSSIAKAGIFIPWRHTLCALSPSYCGRTKPQHPKRCALLLTKCPKKRTTATSLDASRNLYWLLP